MTEELFQYVRSHYWKYEELTSHEKTELDRCHKVSNYHFFKRQAENVENKQLSSKDDQLLKTRLEIQHLSDEQISTYTEEYYETLVTKVVERIYQKYQENMFFNHCPICGVLARTPKAKQCKNGHSWRGSGDD